MRRLFRLRIAVLVLLGGPLLLAVAAVPGWRHRHAGDVGHTHGHSHGDDPAHEHSHPYPHDHSHPHPHMGHGRDGWHVHISLFGLELTLWEPGTGDDAAHEEIAQASASDSRRSSEGEGEGPVFIAASPLAAGWVSLFWIDPAPLPVRVKLAEVDPSPAFSPPADERVASIADAPPVPPPETV